MDPWQTAMAIDAQFDDIYALLACARSFLNASYGSRSRHRSFLGDDAVPTSTHDETLHYLWATVYHYGYGYYSPKGHQVTSISTFQTSTHSNNRIWRRSSRSGENACPFSLEIIITKYKIVSYQRKYSNVGPPTCSYLVPCLVAIKQNVAL
jgi:hypothetical protein